MRDSVKNAMTIVNEKGFINVAFPIIGAGSGGFNSEHALDIKCRTSLLQLMVTLTL
ncbi:MAG: macro domain-containing protein [bacterium]